MKKEMGKFWNQRDTTVCIWNTYFNSKAGCHFLPQTNKTEEVSRPHQMWHRQQHKARLTASCYRLLLLIPEASNWPGFGLVPAPLLLDQTWWRSFDRIMLALTQKSLTRWKTHTSQFQLKQLDSPERWFISAAGHPFHSTHSHPQDPCQTDQLLSPVNKTDDRSREALDNFLTIIIIYNVDSIMQSLLSIAEPEGDSAAGQEGQQRHTSSAAVSAQAAQLQNQNQSMERPENNNWFCGSPNLSGFPSKKQKPAKQSTQEVSAIYTARKSLFRWSTANLCCRIQFLPSLRYNKQEKKRMPPPHHFDCQMN